MSFKFTPTQSETQAMSIPYLEDARADFAPYYDVRDKEPREAQEQVITELAKLGAGNIVFREGYFGDSPRRYGYLVTFRHGQYPAQMEVAGLPMKSETAIKAQKVRVQALYILRDWLKAAVTARIFQPGSDPLVQFLLVDKNRTLAQVLVEDGRLPNLNPLLAGGDVVDGDYTEE